MHILSPALSAAPIFIMAFIILLLCARTSVVFSLCDKSSSFKDTTNASVVVVVCMLAAYSFTSARNCYSPSTYLLYSAVVSAVVLTLSAPVSTEMLPGYMVCFLLVASLTLAALLKPLFPARSPEYAFRSV